MTKIEWVQNRDGTQGITWNPVTGCTKISEGCKNCYAERMARRLAGRYGYPEAPNHFDVTLHPDRLDEPLHWRKPRTVFVCSMSDLFHDDVPEQFIFSILRIIRETPNHTYQILTKRPGRMAPVMREYYARLRTAYGSKAEEPQRKMWLGVTAENQEAADKRIPLLLQTPAAVRFVSIEPCLSAVNVVQYLPQTKVEASSRACLDWVLVGGESGPGARPMHPRWAGDIRDQCQAANVPFFHKQNGMYVLADGNNQWGTWLDGELVDPSRVRAVSHRPDLPFLPHMVRVGKRRAGHLLDGQEWKEFPQESRRY